MPRGCENRPSASRAAPGSPSYLTPAWTARLLSNLEGSRGRRDLPSLRRSALLLVDLQALFLQENSPAWLPAWQAAGPACRRLLDGARHLQVPVIWTKHLHPANDSGGTVAHFFGRLIRASDPLSGLAAGWAPRPGEAVFEKARHPAFAGTNLEGYLRGLGVETLVLAGVQTHLCVLTTAVWAGALDFLPIVAADATAARTEQEHRSAVQVLSAGLAHVASTQEILGAWEAGRREAPP